MYRHTLVAPWRTGPISVKRLAALTLFIPTYLGVQTVHWFCLLLDEVLFPAYRRVEVEAPLFVVGLPRSGTTFLHRVLARDETRFTTSTLWEVLFAPSIIQRKVVSAAARIDGWIGRPFGRLLRRVEARLFRPLDEFHPVTLRAPEEDHLSLLPAFACFLLVLPFPAHPVVWRVARFDEMPAPTRRRIMAFYRSLLQRHVFVHGPRTVLSKNPAFSAYIRSLRETFPDSRVIFCVRDPLKSVPSVLSTMQGGASFFGLDITEPETADRFLDMYRYFTEHALDTLPEWPRETRAFLPMRELTGDVRGTVDRLYERFGWTPAPAFRAALDEEHERARQYTSKHSYSLQGMGLDADTVRRKMHRVIEYFDLGGRSRAARG